MLHVIRDAGIASQPVDLRERQDQRISYSTTSGDHRPTPHWLGNATAADGSGKSLGVRPTSALTSLAAGTRVLSVTTLLPHRECHRGPSTRPIGALIALVSAPLVLSACTSPTPSIPLESLDGHDALVEDIAAALETEGIVEEGSIELDGRSAQFEDGQCRVFARDADAATVARAPKVDAVRAAAAQAIVGSGFAPLEETEVAGGHLQLSSTDEQGARLEITWKASELDVSIHGTADLAEPECTDEVVA